MIKPFHIHLAQLYERYARNEMNSKDYNDLFLLLKQNCDYVYAVIKLQELSYAAHIVNDYSFQHEICQRMEQLLHDSKCTGV